MLTNVELLALDRVIDDKDKSIRNAVMPGSYSVDFTVHVSGNMEVLEDYMKRPTVNVPWTEAYTLFREVAIQAVNEMIARMDRGEVITRRDLEDVKTAGFLSEAIMVETMKQAYDLHEGRCEGSLKERIPEIKEKMEEVKKAIVDGLGRTPSKGHVRTDLVYGEVSEAPEGTASQPEIASETKVGRSVVESGTFAAETEAANRHREGA